MPGFRPLRSDANTCETPPPKMWARLGPIASGEEAANTVSLAHRSTYMSMSGAVRNIMPADGHSGRRTRGRMLCSFPIVTDRVRETCLWLGWERLEQWLAYAPVGPGYNLVASVHSYARTLATSQHAGASRVAPVIARVRSSPGELGADTATSICS